MSQLDAIGAAVLAGMMQGATEPVTNKPQGKWQQCRDCGAIWRDEAPHFCCQHHSELLPIVPSEVEAGLQDVPSADEEFGGSDKLPPEFLQAMEDVPDEATAKLAARLAKPLIALHQTEILKLRERLGIAMSALKRMTTRSEMMARADAKRALKEIRALGEGVENEKS